MHILVDQGFISSHKLHRYNKLSAETVRQFYDHQGNHSTFNMAGFFFGKKVKTYGTQEIRTPVLLKKIAAL